MPRNNPSAIGSITISTPQFTPILPQDTVEGLDFGKYKDVPTLWEGLNAANIGISTVDVDQTALSAKLSLAGPSVNATKTTTLNADGTTSVTGSNVVTQKTPDVPAAPASTALPDDVRKALTAILVANDLKPRLTPEEIATLVASYRSYETNLELFNRPITPTGEDNGWYPYRVNFLASIDPGWYTLRNDYDAMLHVQFADNIQVVNVMPNETAQVIEDFQANLRGLALAFELSGAAGPGAVDAKYENVKETAKRLQGLRTKTNLLVSFPDDHRFDVKFRPRQTADPDNGLDLQPTSRLITAIVRIKGSTDRAQPFAMYATANQSVSIRKLKQFTSPVKVTAQYVPDITDRKPTIWHYFISGKHPIGVGGVTHNAIVPAFKNSEPTLKVALLDGDLQTTDDGQFANLAYGLITPYPIEELTVDVAGGDTTWNNTAPAPADLRWQRTFTAPATTDLPLNQGAFRVRLPKAKTPVKSIKLPVRFAAKAKDADGQPIVLTALAVLHIGPADTDEKKAAGEAGTTKVDVAVKADDPLKIDALDLRLKPDPKTAATKPAVNPAPAPAAGAAAGASAGK